jgi:hypothetical protein
MPIETFGAPQANITAPLNGGALITTGQCSGVAIVPNMSPGRYVIKAEGDFNIYHDRIKVGTVRAGQSTAFQLEDHVSLGSTIYIEDRNPLNWVAARRTDLGSGYYSAPPTSGEVVGVSIAWDNPDVSTFTGTQNLRYSQITTDGGQTWKQVDNYNWMGANNAYQRTGVVVTEDGTTFYRSASARQTTTTLQYSKDAGSTWTTVDTTQPNAHDATYDWGMGVVTYNNKWYHLRGRAQPGYYIVVWGTEDTVEGSARLILGAHNNYNTYNQTDTYRWSRMSNSKYALLAQYRNAAKSYAYGLFDLSTLNNNSNYQINDSATLSNHDSNTWATFKQMPFGFTAKYNLYNSYNYPYSRFWTKNANGSARVEDTGFGDYKGTTQIGGLWPDVADHYEYNYFGLWGTMYRTDQMYVRYNDNSNSMIYPTTKVEMSQHHINGATPYRDGKVYPLDSEELPNLPIRTAKPNYHSGSIAWWTGRKTYRYDHYAGMVQELVPSGFAIYEEI